jgi:hypothetical protein
VDPRSGHVLPPLARVALEEGETAARNLDAELTGRPLEAFTLHDEGFVVSVGARRGVADIAGITSGGQLAHLLKDAIEWEYRQSVSRPRGWDPVARVNAKRLGGTGSITFAVGSGYAAVQEPIRIASQCEVMRRVSNRRNQRPLRPVHHSVVGSVVLEAQRHLSIGSRLSLCGCSGR